MGEREPAADELQGQPSATAFAQTNTFVPYSSESLVPVQAHRVQDHTGSCTPPSDVEMLPTSIAKPEGTSDVPVQVETDYSANPWRKPCWNKLVNQGSGDTARATAGEHHSTEHTFNEHENLRVLYVFSGARRSNSLAEMITAISKRINMRVDIGEWDIENGPEYDLADDTRWNRLLALINAGELHATIWSPPCSTYSGCRSETDRGPRPLRGASGRERYGSDDVKLTSEEKEAVRVGTLLAVRTAEGIRACDKLGIRWLLENPPQRLLRSRRST